MRFRNWPTSVTAVALLVVGASAAAVVYVSTHGVEVATTILSVPILLISGFTLAMLLPRPAQLAVMRQDELEHDDLIFYVYPQPAVGDEPQIPRDFLFQLTVAVANIGGRKAVLSRVLVDAFVSGDGSIVALPDVPTPIEGMRWQTSTGYVNGSRQFANTAEPGPWILEPDDVIALRFNCRRGVEWTVQWTLDRLRETHDRLSVPVAAVRGRMLWRRGAELVDAPFTLPIQVVQQDLFVQRLTALTERFTTLPKIDPRPIRGVTVPEGGYYG